MKILIVNTSELSGGAALAANRLKDALNKQGEKAMMLVRDKQSDDPTVVGIGGGLGSSLRFLWERVRILLSLRFNRSHLFDLDTGYCGF
ncbi:MAG: glycosyl transferase, partial [Prevotella sp.]|nr:glycosyl transferase [Prevotella sp.]